MFVVVVAALLVRALLEDCMRVLFYRDCRALNRIQIAKATVEGTVVSDAYTVR